MRGLLQWRTFEVLALVVLFVVVVSDVKSKEVVTHNFIVHVNGGPDVAFDVAKRNGFKYIGPAKVYAEDAYHYIHQGLPHARMKRSLHHTRLLKAHPKVTKAYQLTGFRRAKRGYKPLKPMKDMVPDLEKFIQRNPEYRILFDAESSRRDGDNYPEPRDPLFNKEWFLKNTGQAGGKKDLDLNVIPAWKHHFTGKGVVTAIMDDGIDYLHPDLADNYHAKASYDFSSNDPYPYPRYTDTWFNSHGTRCAGEIAAAKDNGICGVGVAFNSKVAGLRMLDQPFMTDLIEANAMSHMMDSIDIYSASWGPTDDGKTVDGPRNATMNAIVRGVNEGRHGKGNIYVWASGDGGQEDDCNADGYAACMWTTSINSATNDGQTAGYDESCSSTLASTFSNGKSGLKDAGVASTDLYGNCTTTHSGTSAAAPEAAGVFALALEANPNLTWIDIQHLVVLTSKKNQLSDPFLKHHWQRNGAGLEFNHLFGYGVLDASAMVDLGGRWVKLPERVHCTAGFVTEKKRFGTGISITLTINTKACKGTPDEINYLEHIQAIITLRSSYRGNVAIFLTSPMGTKSMILSQRPNDDDAKNGFTKWPFMTTHCWGENPAGEYKLELTMVPPTDEPADQWSMFHEWSLELHGTKEPPYKYQISDPVNQKKLELVKRMHATEGFVK